MDVPSQCRSLKEVRAHSEIRSNLVGVSGRWGSTCGKQLAREALRFILLYVLKFDSIDLMK